jgi:ABC-type lipoprotein export system ATPase subunit
MSKQVLPILRFVKVNPDRGYGRGIFSVRGERQTSSKEVLLFNDRNSQVGWIYEAHTFRDAETARANIQLAEDRRVASQQIGRKQR